MADREPQMIEVGEGAGRRQIAVIADLPAIVNGPGVLWLTGLKSDMGSTKAAALADWARTRGFGCTRFDYSGHGRSEGRFDEATIGDWLEETAAVFTQCTTGSQILAGSSTGGHIALLLLRRLLRQDPRQAKRIAGLVLVAPAWDLTEELMWQQFPEETRQEIMQTGRYERPSAYGDPYSITRTFIEEGRNHLLARQPFDPGRPVHIIHGRLDPDVPFAHSLDLMKFLQGGWEELTEVRDGEHRLSRPQDIALLLDAVERMLTRTGVLNAG